MITLTVTSRVTGASADAWARAFDEPTEALEAVGVLVNESVGETIARRVDPWGQAWAPPSPATVAIKAKRSNQRRPANLNASRRVRIDAGAKRVSVGLLSWIAKIHHGGAPNNRIFGKAPAPIPARPILPYRGGRVDPSPELREQIRDAFMRAFKAAVLARSR